MVARKRGELNDAGEITFKSQETKEVSDKIKEYSEESSCNGDGIEDPLSKALGNREHPGRVRAVSSYSGWKVGLPGYKSRSGAVDMEKVSERFRAQITQDIIANIPAILAAQGLKLVPFLQARIKYVQQMHIRAAVPLLTMVNMICSLR